jgi:hypothetical protein
VVRRGIHIGDSEVLGGRRGGQHGGEGMASGNEGLDGEELKMELLQATRMPPREFVAEMKCKESREGGRKRLAENSVTSWSLVS